jgi:hypothetical protein
MATLPFGIGNRWGRRSPISNPKIWESCHGTERVFDCQNSNSFHSLLYKHMECNTNARWFDWCVCMAHYKTISMMCKMCAWSKMAPKCGRITILTESRDTLGLGECHRTSARSYGLLFLTSICIRLRTMGMGKTLQNVLLHWVIGWNYSPDR